MKYGVITWHAGQRPVRHEFNEPLDALVAGVGYLRDGYLVTLSKPTCDALQSGNFSESIGSAARAARLAALFARSLRGRQIPR